MFDPPRVSAGGSAPEVLAPPDVVIFLGVSFVVTLIVWWAIDRYANGGVGWLRRWRILKHGQPGRAKLLSAAIVPERSRGMRWTTVFSVVYEVLPAQGPAFRARGFVLSRPSSTTVWREGEVVDVRFDPSDHTVLQVPRDPRELERRQDAARRAREEALLRGGPGGV